MRKFFRCLLLYAVPCIFWWFFVLYIHFGYFQIQGSETFMEIYNKFCEPISELFSGNIDINAGHIILAIILFLIGWWIVILYFALFFLIIFFAIPIDMFFSGFNFSNLLLWLSTVVFVLTIIAAVDFKLGHFLADTTHEVGHHYEAEYNDSDDKIKIKKVTDYEGGGEWILNVFLFLFRMILIAAFGLIIFFIRLKKSN